MANTKLKKRPVALIILSGFGWSPLVEGNAVAQAYTPFLDKYLSTFKHTLLEASGECDWQVFREPDARGRDRRGQGFRASPDGTPFGRRRAFEERAPLRALEDGGRARGPTRLRPRLYRRARHAA